MLTRLLLKDFGPHIETELTLGKVNVFQGPNGAGKSYILDALRALRFGAAREVPVNANGALTREGADQGWIVEAQVGEKVLRRSRSKGPTVGELDFALGNTRLFGALFLTDAFTFGMTPEERRELVASLVGPAPAIILARLDAIPGNDPSDIVKAGLVKVREAVTGGNLRRAFAAATEARREAGRRAEGYKARAALEIPDVDVETSKGVVKVSTLAASAIGENFDKASKMLAAAQRAQGAAEAAARASEGAAEAAKELETIGAGPGWTAEDEKNREKTLRQLKGVRELLSAAKARVADRFAAADRIEHLLKKADGECPTCGTPMKSVKDRVAKEHARLAKEGGDAEADVVRLAGEIKELEAIVDAFQKKASMASEWANRKAVLEAKVGKAKPVEGAPAPVDLEKAQAAYARIDKIRQARIAFDAAKIEVGKAARWGEEAAAEVALWEKVEEAVRPDQLPEGEEVLTKLNATLANAAQMILPGINPKLTPGWELVAAGRPATLLSDSEQIRLSLACSVALAVLSGRKMLVLDRFESLTRGNRTLALTMIRDLVTAGQLETVLVCISEDDIAKAYVPKTEMLKSFWVEAGKVTPVAQVAAK